MGAHLFPATFNQLKAQLWGTRALASEKMTLVPPLLMLLHLTLPTLLLTRFSTMISLGLLLSQRTNILLRLKGVALHS
jgi:hypothetical protein